MCIYKSNTLRFKNHNREAKSKSSEFSVIKSLKSRSSWHNGLQPGKIFVPQETSGNVWWHFGCHNQGELLAASEARPGMLPNARQSTVQAPKTEKGPAANANCANVRKHWVKTAIFNLFHFMSHTNYLLNSAAHQKIGITLTAWQKKIIIIVIPYPFCSKVTFLKIHFV